jgi:hypothetical protein
MWEFTFPMRLVIYADRRGGELQEDGVDTNLVCHYCREVKNITISLPDELAHRAKVFAAENNTSVSRYVGALLAEKLESDTGYRAAMKRWRSRTATHLNSSGRRYPLRDQLYDR